MAYIRKTIRKKKNIKNITKRISVFKRRSNLTTSLNKYVELYKNYSLICRQNVEPILQPLLPSNIITNKTLEELLDISRNVLAIVVEHTYSLVPYFITPNIRITTQDKIILEKNSGNCIAFATKISLLLSTYQIPNCFIPATIPPRLIQPGFPDYGHSVILIETPKNRRIPETVSVL